MVRNGGKRAYEDNRFGRTAALVELMPGTNSRRGNLGELPFYQESTGKSAFANFARVYQVPLVVLDLCVFRPDGSATLDMNAEIPELMIEPWRNRHKSLCNFFGKALVPGPC